MTSRSSTGFAFAMRRPSSPSAAQIARSSAMTLSNPGRRVVMGGLMVRRVGKIARRDIAMMVKRSSDFAHASALMQRLTLHRAPAQQPPLLLRKVGARMDRAAIVPHQEIAELPHMLEDKLAPLADLV